MGPEFLASKRAVVDEEIPIKVHGLSPNQPVTVTSFLSYNTHLFIGFAHFFADKTGRIDLATTPSLGGTYTGIQNMGIFTSAQGLVGRKVFRRLIVMDVSQSLKFELAAWPGHLNLNFFHKYGHYHDLLRREEILCKFELERSYIAPGVKRVPVGAPHDIRGTLFVPDGEGPFPAVIDMFGGIGNCVEIRAALYAKRGYLALALGYINFADLPVKSVVDIEFNYFTKAVDFLLAHPKAQKGKVAMVSTSLSSSIGLNMALRDPRVVLTIVVNTAAFLNLDPKSEFLYPKESLARFGSDSQFHFQDGFIELVRPREELPKPVVVATAPLTHSHVTKVCYLIGKEDKGMPSLGTAQLVKNHFSKFGRGDQVEIFVVPHQGHLMEPPFMPLADVVPMTSDLDVMINYGGERKYHLESQLLGWNMLTGFLDKHLRRYADFKSKL